MPQNCIAPRPEESGSGEAMVQGLTDMSETQSKSVQGLQLSMYPITLKVCVSLSLYLTLKRESVLFTLFFFMHRNLIKKYYSLA